MTTPKNKLVELGCPENDTEIYEELMRKASTVEELERELGERHISLDADQYILPVFRPLYQRDGQIRERVREQLRVTGLPDDIIDKYFTAMGDQPGFVLSFNPKYQSIPQEAKTRFLGAARGTMFNTFKSYLEK